MSARVRASSQAVLAVATVLWALPARAEPAAARCENAKDERLVEAIDQARKFLSNSWLAAGENYYLAFSAKAPAANPFDLAARGAPATAQGYIWVSGLRCSIMSAAPDAPVVLGFGASAMSFHDSDGRWTKPFSVERLTVLKVSKLDGSWEVEEQRGEDTALMPGDAIRRPTRADVPAPNPTLKIPCADDQRWTGRRCSIAGGVAARAGAKRR